VPVIRDQGEMFGWNTWLEPNGLDEAILSDGPVFSDAALCLDAAIAGQGVFLAWETLACDALRSGRLVAPFPGRYPNGFAYWYVTGQYARRSQSVRDFETWLRSELEASIEAD
jgi:LysR family glycine cleavage system transcriptional activator